MSEPHEATSSAVTATGAKPTQLETADDRQHFETRSTPSVSVPQLPNYEELTKIGEGGMGLVFRAKQKRTERFVAIKFLHAAGALDTNHRARFDAEVRALGRIHHPNIVQVYEVGDDVDRPYFTMEYFAGGTLSKRIRDNPLTPEQAARIMVSIALAVEAAHQLKILHRDLKPGNILLDEAGIPKVSDFGLAKFADRDDGLTVNGALLGTPPYMAPEQATGDIKALGTWTDVYGLGATFYELLCGKPPFKEKTAEKTLRKVETEEPPAPRSIAPAVPAELEAVCLKCLRKDPKQRYSSANEFADELNRWLNGQKTLQRPPSRWEKLRKRINRHRWKVAMLTLLPLTLLTLAFTDPRRRMEIQLALGQPVTLIDSTGPPKWHEWFQGGTSLERSAAGDPAFGFQTATPSVLILGYRSKTDSYQLTGDLRHIRSNNEDGNIGMFVGLQRPIDRDVNCGMPWVGISYSDFFNAAVLVQPNLKDLHRLDGSCYFTYREKNGDHNPHHQIGAYRFKPQNSLPNDWRRLRIHVTPTDVTVYWWVNADPKVYGISEDGQFIEAFTIDSDSIAKVQRWQVLSTQKVFPEFQYENQRNYSKQYLGVFATNSAVAFRNVQLQPLPR